MKKIFTLLFLTLIGATAFSQTTYYWIGGVGPASFTSNSNWNTALDGSGDARSVVGSADTDILIYDGSNIGGSTATTGNVVVTSSSDTVGRLIFRNNANVKFSRTTAGSANINIQGEGTALNDLIIEAGSVVTLGDDIYNYDVRILLGLTAPVTTATGLVNGTLYLSPLSSSVHTASYITSRVTNGLVFGNGAQCFVTDSTSASPFNGSSNASVLFQAGSSMYYYSGRSPFGNSSATQFANFEKGSNFYVRGTNRSYLDGTTLYASSSWVNLKSFANVYVENNATLFSDGPIYRIDDLTIASGSSFLTHTSGVTPVLGNLSVNGLFDFPSGSNSLVMGGHALQTISGTGTINVPNFVVANYSDVLLLKSINVVSATNIVGKINFGATGQITGIGNFTSRVASAVTTGAGSTTAGSYQVTFTAPAGINGYYISGAGLAPNTHVVGFGASANSIYLSKPALSTATGITFTFGSDTATLQTANPNGFNDATGSIVNAGTKSFQTSTNFIVDAPTTAPFGISTTAVGNMTIGNLTLNAAATTHYNLRLTGTLTLNSGLFTIRPSDTVRILSGNPIAGTSFGPSKYIVSSVSGSNKGVLRMDAFDTERLFPVGTTNYFLPATITPTTLSDFAVSVFEGATLDGTVNGSPVGPAEQSNIVNAYWTIDRVSGTNDASIGLGWNQVLEGALFTNFADAEIGISRYNGAEWDIATGTGNNVTNTATSLFSSFSPFRVSKKGSVLPVQLRNLSATLQSNSVEINWTVSNELGIQQYEVERKSGTGSYVFVGAVNAIGASAYRLLDFTATGDILYYRLKIVSQSGEIKYSNIVLLRKGNTTQISVYPNPVVNSLQLTGLSNNSQIRIFNSAGQLVETVLTNSNTFGLDVSSLKSGMYVLEVLKDGIKVTQQSFLKQ